MEEIDISKFKATCLEVLERVRRTRKPILVTRFGESVAEVTPPSNLQRKGTRLGSMVGTVRIKGDVISPISDAEDWEALSSRELLPRQRSEKLLSLMKSRSQFPGSAFLTTIRPIIS
jgi:PHD/YefM family antitoxin component YafN of YafNO toxin-antitoxin module